MRQYNHRVQLRTIDVRGQKPDYRAVIPRGSFDVEQALDAVRPICDAVRDRGVDALVEFSQRFDGVVPESFRVPVEVLARSAETMDADVRAALEESIRRRRAVALAEREPDSITVELAPGASVEIRTVPVRRVGLYVPGGLAPLASSVLMNVVPAQVAGVESLALATPPSRAHGGLPDPTVLGLCHLLGVDEVYAVGGAQAIAMFAHGVAGLCEPVDLVTGPGNIYVVAAKRLLRGLVGIDSEAGPTEIMVLADATADPAFVAADLISQAEHDPMAGSVLVTDAPALADAVNALLDDQIDALDNTDRIRTALSGSQSAVVLVDDLDQGIAVADAYGAEHLEIHTSDARDVARRIRNAGAIFVGPYAPVPLGDYSAGSTHVLPTSGTAAHSSGLTVRSFCKTVHVIEYSAEALAELGPLVEAFASAELLPGHREAIAIRTRRPR
ncbi:histidinol dehydrogenase [Propioniciclava tarda]|uniref:Histidinol dehydrogenase n=1 Tax=Propioniciclava tarda TaxID=433330 RepID=A0A4Q9KN19_PROTD|nr:histidinol dehydrogenase [Propioniciclava tarda]